MYRITTYKEERCKQPQKQSQYYLHQKYTVQEHVVASDMYIIHTCMLTQGEKITDLKILK